jgi:hypothetical protein
MKIGDLDALKKTMHNFFDGKVIDEPAYILRDVFCLIDGAPELGYEDGILSVENTTRRAIELEEAYNNGWSDGFSEGENERPQGEWVVHSCYKDVIICSNCNSGDSRWHKDFKFCPNCGADMRKGGAE